MHARIGAPSSLQTGRAIGIERCDRLLEGFLNTRITGLTLPTAVKRAVVLQAEGNPTQRRSRRHARDNKAAPTETVNAAQHTTEV
jgi:hypothetical protein